MTLCLYGPQIRSIWKMSYKRSKEKQKLKVSLFNYNGNSTALVGFKVLNNKYEQNDILFLFNDFFFLNQ